MSFSVGGEFWNARLLRDKCPPQFGVSFYSGHEPSPQITRGMIYDFTNFISNEWNRPGQDI